MARAPYDEDMGGYSSPPASTPRATTPPRKMRAGGMRGQGSRNFQAMLETVINNAIEERLKNYGQVFGGVFEHPDGEAVTEVDSDKTDIWVWAKVVPARPPGYVRGRLFLAATSLHRLPQAGESCCIIIGAGQGITGGAYVLWGDGGTAGDVPTALDATTSLLSPPTGRVIVESRDTSIIVRTDKATIEITTAGKIKIDAEATQDVQVNGGSLKVARDTDPVNAGTLTGTAGPWPVLFTHVDSKTAAVTAGPTVTLTGKITDGASRFKG